MGRAHAPSLRGPDIVPSNVVQGRGVSQHRRMRTAHVRRFAPASEAPAAVRAMIFPLAALVSIAAGLACAQGAQSDPSAPPGGTVAATLRADERYATFVTVLDEAELWPMLRGSGPFTIFAPTEEAFAEAGEAVLERLRSDVELARRFLAHHTIPNDVILTSDGRLTANGSVNPVTRLLWVPDGDSSPESVEREPPEPRSAPAARSLERRFL